MVHGRWEHGAGAVGGSHGKGGKAARGARAVARTRKPRRLSLWSASPAARCGKQTEAITGGRKAGRDLSSGYMLGRKVYGAALGSGLMAFSVAANVHA